MSHSESLALSFLEKRPAKCMFSKGHSKNTCHCAGTGWITACYRCEGSGWDKKSQAPCRRCNGYGGFSAPLCQHVTVKDEVKIICEEVATVDWNDHHFCAKHAEAHA